LSGVGAFYGGSITLMGAKTTVHHNCTSGSRFAFGLKVYEPTSKIQLVHPLTKESVATDNPGGGNWGAYSGADIDDIQTIYMKGSPEEKQQAEKAAAEKAAADLEAEKVAAAYKIQMAEYAEKNKSFGVWKPSMGGMKQKKQKKNDAEGYDAGVWVEIVGLKGGGEQYNGCNGTVVTTRNDGRINVRLNDTSNPYTGERRAGGVKGLKRENLQLPNAPNYINPNLKNDKEIVMAAVAHDGHALRHASEELKNDKEIVMAAVAQDGHALRHASKELKNDKEIVMAAVAQDGHALEYASKELKNDKEIVMAAVAQDGDALVYASEELKNDKEIVMAAVVQNGDALVYASKELKNDQEIVMAAKARND